MEEYYQNRIKMGLVGFVVLSIVILFVQNCNGQYNYHSMPINEETGKVTYTLIKEVPEVSKDELFLRAMTWVNQTYNSGKSVIQFSDKESGKIMGKANVDALGKALGMVYKIGYFSYSFTIQVKDGKYKYEVTDIFHNTIEPEKIASVGPIEKEEPKVGFMFAPSKKQWKDMKMGFEAEIFILQISLNKAIQKGEKDF